MTQKLHATAKLVQGFRLAVDNGRFHSVCLDLPPDEGTNVGPTALELAVMSYAGCFATIFILTAKKMRFKLRDLEVKLDAIKSEEAGTVTEANFSIIVQGDIPEDRIQRIFKLTVENCPVGKLFEKAEVKINYDLKTEKE